MSKKRFTLIFMMITFILTTNLSFGASHHYFKTQKFSNGKTANYVLVNFNAKDITLGIGTANNRIYSADSLQNIANTKAKENSKAFSAINGTYFSAYNNIPVPYGTIIDDGKLLHIGNYGAVFGVTKDKKIVIDNVNIEITGSINGVENQYYTWGINHPRTEPDAIMIFTPEFSEQTMMPEAKNVVIRNGVVSAITSGNTAIPQDGFVISFNPSMYHLVSRFEIGDKVNYTPEFKSRRENATEMDHKIWDEVVYAVGAGPSLILNTAITADGAKEGFTEAKINTQRAQRSFIGFREDGRVVMGTVSNASLTELAQVCKELNLKSAMNLDGGASSGLMYNGSYKTSPGRKINNSLIFFENQK